MRARGVRWLPWGIGVLTSTVAIALLVLVIVDPMSDQARAPNGGGVAVAAFEALVLVTLAVIGSVVASRQTRNVVGWILCVIPLSLGVLIFCSGAYWEFDVHDDGARGAAAVVAWFGSWTWVPAMIPTVTLFPLLFPTGRPPTPRWRFVVWMAVAAIASVLFTEMFRPGRLAEFPVDNPFGLGIAASPLVHVGDVVWLVTTILSISSLVVRYRRSRGEERQQIKWVVVAALFFVLMFALSGVIQNTLGHEDLGFSVIILGWLLIASAVAVAMLRYRLYDIDVVINRALVYGSLTAMLAGTYLGSVLLLQLALDRFTQGSGLAVAASTLATAALVRPARARIQSTVDRRFFRKKYDATQTLERFGARVRQEVDLDLLTAELREVIAETMQPAHVTLWVKGPDR
jgi:hypothetical protein